MIETSAYLVDHVFPEVPIRQWVLSFPWPLRLLFTSNPDALSRCLTVTVRAIQTALIQWAGLTTSSGARTGVVTVIQRFGSALSLNVPLHMLILDGVYTQKQDGPRFHRVTAPNIMGRPHVTFCYQPLLVAKIDQRGVIATFNTPSRWFANSS